MMKLVLLVFALSVAAYHVHAADQNDLVEELKELDVFRLRKSPLGCPFPVVGDRCPEENPLYYFKCCGDINTNCCFRLQDWAIVLIAIMIALIIISIFVNLIRCIFCY